MLQNYTHPCSRVLRFGQISEVCPDIPTAIDISNEMTLKHPVWFSYDYMVSLGIRYVEISDLKMYLERFQKSRIARTRVHTEFVYNVHMHTHMYMYIYIYVYTNVVF